jgi:hypothetical protein
LWPPAAVGRDELSELDARDFCPPIVGRVITYNDGPLNETPALATCRTMLVDAVAEGLAASRFPTLAGPTALVAGNIAGRELAVKIE